jgi:hypothetical protein
MNARKWTSIKGHAGQWWATVRWDDGSKEVLPCVHQCYWKNDERGPYYHDPLDGVSMQDPKLLKHFEQLRSAGRVILTSDDVDEAKHGDGRFRRTGYLAARAVS